MAGPMSMMGGEDQEPNPLSMVSQLLDPKTKKVLASNADNPEFLSRVHELAPAIASKMTGGQPVPPPNPAKIPVPAQKIQTKNQTNTDVRDITGSKTNNYDTGTLDQIADWTRKQPEYMAQAASAQQMANLLSMSGGHKDRGDWIVRPLAALADSQTGSHLTATAPDPDAKNATLLKYADELSKRKSDMMKTIMEGAQKLKTGQESQQQINDLKQLVMRGTGDGGSGFSHGWEDRLDWQKHKYGLNQILTDPAQAKLLTSYQNINNALKNFEASGRSIQEFKELQQVLRANAGAGGRSGVEERAGTYATTAGTSKDALVQAIFGDPQDVYKSSPKIVDMIYEMAKAELQSKRSQAAAQISTRTKPMSSFYADPRRAMMAEDFQKTVDDRKKQFDIDDNAQAPAPIGTGGGGKIKVRSADGTDVRMIDPGDLPHALADHYVEVK